MNLLGNYNTASQKYGIELVKQLSELGLPPQYLLSACRFVKENNIPLLSMINQFKEWTKFVIKYNKYDANRLSYDDFLRIISQEKSKHIVPNLIWQNEIASLGKLNNAKDVQKIPVKNQWCIKSQKWFDRYTDKGYVFFVIYLPNEPLPFTFVVVAVCGGNVEYYDTQDYEQFEDLRGGNENNSDHEVYQRKLPNEIVSYLYDIAATQTEERENKIKTENKDYKINKNMKKQVIRLTEGDLHRIIKESVDNILSEPHGNLYGLKPLQGQELFDRITGYLQRFGDVRVSNFYSDEYRITIAMHKSVRGKRKEIDEIMENFGYTIYDAGANDDYVMLTYKKRSLKESKETISAHKFLPELNKTYTHLYREYSRWQYSPAKPEGMDEAIDAIIKAMHKVQDIIHDIEWKQNGMPIYDTEDPR